MTYKLNPELDRITSSITLIFPNGTRQEYRNGKTVAEKAFSERYRIVEIRAVDDVVEIALEPETGVVDDVRSFENSKIAVIKPC